jgi:catechol-2,3-dioxygenase
MNEEMGAGVFRTGHVGLNVSDVGQSRKLYGNVFGFRVMGKSDE